MTRFALAALALAAQLAASPALAQIIDETGLEPNPAVEQQRAGEFAPLERPSNLPVGAIQPAWDQAPDTAGVYRVAYDPSRTVRVVLREAMTTTIRLPGWDRIKRIVLGDQRFFDSEQLDDATLEVWLKTPGADTSLKVLGASGAIYSFYLRGETWNSRNLPDLIVILEAPKPRIIEAAPAGPPSPREKPGRPGAQPVKEANEWLHEIPFDPTAIKRDLVMTGAESLAPNDIFRDEQFTYICYGERADSALQKWPAVFAVVDQIDMPVNFRTRNGCLVVETVGPLTLRRGDSALCIRFADDPNAKRKPQVDRQLPGDRPAEPSTARPRERQDA